MSIAVELVGNLGSGWHQFQAGDTIPEGWLYLKRESRRRGPVFEKVGVLRNPWKWPDCSAGNVGDSTTRLVDIRLAGVA